MIKGEQVFLSLFFSFPEHQKINLLLHREKDLWRLGTWMSLTFFTVQFFIYLCSLVSVYREGEAQNTAPMFITVYVSSNWPLLLVDNITNQGSHQKQK